MSPNKSLATSGPSTQLGKLKLRDPVHVGREESLQNAASVMRHEGISSLVVDTNPPSFLTERDLVQAVASGRPLSDRVGEIATRGPVWVPPTLTVAQAAALMVGTGMRHLVVVDSVGAVVGVLSIRDAFEVLVRSVDPGGWLSAFGAALGDIG